MNSRLIYSPIKNLHTVANIRRVLKNPNEGATVEVKGWIKSLRKMKDRLFVDISDGSCNEKLQIVLPKSLKPADLSVGASVKADGLIKHNPNGSIEIDAKSMSIIGKCNTADGYPFVPRQIYSQDYIRQYLHLRPRTSNFTALLRIRNAAVRAIDEFYRSKGFILIHTPVLTSNDCEGAGEVFSVRPDNENLAKSMSKTEKVDDTTYFDTKVFLTVSGQLHLEAAVHGLSKVYTLGPTFRAENSKSRLHLSEFYMLEAEEAFVEDLHQITADVEALLKSVTCLLIDNCVSDIAMFRKDIDDNFKWVDKSFITLTYDEAIEILEKKVDEYKGGVVKGQVLTKEHEHFLVKYGGGVPTFVVNWPVNLKPFYMKQLDDKPEVAAFDLLVPNVGELVGGSLRENSYDRLKSKIPQGNTQLDWYLDLRKFGGVPSGGYGMGFERYLQFLLNLQNIKDTIPFPRWPHNCSM